MKRVALILAATSAILGSAVPTASAAPIQATISAAGHSNGAPVICRPSMPAEVCAAFGHQGMEAFTWH